jgi:hypothetical protein
LQIVQPQHAKASMDFGAGEVQIDPTDIVGPIVIGGILEEKCNVFCMYSITEPTDLFPISPKVESFGDSFVMVKNTQEFIKRLHAAANKAGFKCEYRPVEYFDISRHSGRTRLFQKCSVFEYQN